MADSTTWLETIAAAQSQKEVTANALFDSQSPASSFGRHAEACSGLTWGYYGGRIWDGTNAYLKPNGTVLLTGSATNYVEADTGSPFGQVTANTSGWTAGSIRMAKVVTSASAVTSYEDHRTFTFPGSAAAGFVTSVALSMPSEFSVSGSPVTGSGTLSVSRIAQDSNKFLAGPAAGSPTTAVPTFRAIVAADLPGGVGTVSSVNLTQPAAGITVSGGPITGSGSITLALANDLAALEGLSSTGYAKRTGTDTWAIQSTIPAADLPTFVGDDSGSPDSSVKGAVPVANQGDAANGKFLAADGTWKASYLPQNSKSAAYTTVLADSGKHILHPSADTSARTFTIDSNANVPYPIGTAITFVNQASAGVMTISITSDTMRLAGAGTTGSRTLAANGIATALKITSTEWIISGTGLT